MKKLQKIAWMLLVAAGAAATASAQISLPGLPVPQLPTAADPLAGTLRTAQSQLRTDVRKLRIREWLRTDRKRVEADPDGQPILRGQVGALSPTPEALMGAREAGFMVLSEESLAGLGFTIVVLRAPEGMSTRRALKRLRELDPQGSYDYNHLYLDSGMSAATVDTAAPAVPTLQPARNDAMRIGLIDSGVDGSHPSLVGTTIHRFGCNGAMLPQAHGTAVASLLVGQAADFHGAMPGAELYAADVFCGNPGGSISLLAVALDWMARESVPVINISLVGAKSVLLTQLVRAMGQRGHLMVAAVGNDGPAAAPLYPAAYPEVIGVTGVDASARVLPEACRGKHVAYAAPGADMRAAAPGNGWAEVRGTSFASPIVAGLLAASLANPDPAKAQAAREQLTALAVDLGPKGVDTTYGNGLVGASLRVPPKPGN
ncbi:MAG: S8 family serine peptidase [Steroidobacteraceae bacterium]